MNNLIDAYALSPPSAEVTEPSGKGYVLIPLGKGEVPELMDYPYEVLMVRPDYVEANPKIATAVARAISRGGALSTPSPKRPKQLSAPIDFSCRTNWPTTCSSSPIRGSPMPCPPGAT